MVVILYHNAIRTSNIGIRRLYSDLSSSQSFIFSPGQSSVCDRRQHVRNIFIQHDVLIWNFGYSKKGQNGNDNEDNGDQKDDNKNDSKEDEKEEKKEERIPTYDEYYRFRDSSRPPDSHYPPGPGPGYRRSSSRNLRTDLYFCILIILVCNFLF